MKNNQEFDISIVYHDFVNAISALWSTHPKLFSAVLIYFALLYINKKFGFSFYEAVKGLISEFFAWFDKRGNKVQKLDFLIIAAIVFSWFVTLKSDLITEVFNYSTEVSVVSTENLIFSFLVLVTGYLCLLASLAICKLKEL